MSYLILLSLIIILIITSFLAFKKDIMSPTFISCSVYAFSVVLAMLGLNSWNNELSLSLQLIVIVVLGLLSFFAGEILARKFFGKDINEYKSKNHVKTINVNKWIYWLTICFIIITMILLVVEIKRICNFYDFYSNSIPELLAFYRTKIGLFSTDLMKDNVDINFIVKQMKKTCDVLCVVWMYIFFNNRINKVGLKKNILNFIPIVLCLACTLLTSGRSLLMHMIVSFVMMYLIIYYLNRKDSRLFKTIKILILSVIVVLPLFYLILPLTGRTTTENGFDYITFYLGTPIPSFNRSLNTNNSNEYIGEDTFSGVYYSLNKLNIIDYEKPSTHEWTKFGSFSSNVYTSFRSYYRDFGVIGVLLCQLLFGFLVSILYIRLKSVKGPLLTIIYSYFGYVLIDQIRDEQFYNLISTSTIAYLLIIVVLYFVYIKHDYIIDYLKVKLKKQHI